MLKSSFLKSLPCFFALLFTITLFSCGSTPPSGQENERAAPAWIKQPARTVDGGYIVYVGSGEDHSPERANFKAEAMALQDLSNECSFSPKGTRIEDHYDEVEYGIHRSYAKVAVEFQECEAAKGAVSPDDMRNLASVPLAEEVKKYQEMVDNPEPQENAPLVASNDAEGVNPMATAPPTGSGGQHYYAGATPYYGSVVVIQDQPSFFIYRQQVAYVKQDVILAPPAQYPHGEPISTQPIQTVAMASTSIRQYEAANPALKTSSEAFSTVRPNAASHQANALRQGPAPGTVMPRSADAHAVRAQERREAERAQRESETRPQKNRAGARSQNGKHPPGENGKGKKKKKRRGHER